MRIATLGRLPFTLLYLASLAVLLIVGRLGGGMGNSTALGALLALAATPAYLLTGYLRIALGPDSAWAAPGLVIIATALIDLALHRAVKALSLPHDDGRRGAM